MENIENMTEVMEKKSGTERISTIRFSYDEPHRGKLSGQSIDALNETGSKKQKIFRLNHRSFYPAIGS